MWYIEKTWWHCNTRFSTMVEATKESAMDALNETYTGISSLKVYDENMDFVAKAHINFD